MRARRGGVTDVDFRAGTERSLNRRMPFSVELISCRSEPAPACRPHSLIPPECVFPDDPGPEPLVDLPLDGRAGRSSCTPTAPTRQTSGPTRRCADGGGRMTNDSISSRRWRCCCVLHPCCKKPRHPRHLVTRDVTIRTMLTSGAPEGRKICATGTRGQPRVTRRVRHSQGISSPEPALWGIDGPCAAVQSAHPAESRESCCGSAAWRGP